MKLYYLLLLFLYMGLVSCSDQKRSSSNVQQENARPNIHTSQNSLDWSGNYSGILPCASCEGIETTLSLNKNFSYELSMIYLGENAPNTFESEGVFSWSEDGRIITLDDEDEPNQYFVGENYLAKLDGEGNRVTGDLEEHYMLDKEQAETE